MPLKQCQNGARKGWSWNDSTCYTGKDARKQALQQGVAMELNKHKNGEASEWDSVSELAKTELTEQDFIEAALTLDLDLEDITAAILNFRQSKD